MKKIALGLFALLVGIGFAGTATAQEELTCEDYRCQFQAMIEERCPCDAHSNHGRYVSCVAHVVKELTAQGLPKNCGGKLKRCAARSICGKQSRDFHTCTTSETFTCDTTAGVCTNDGVTPCLVDTDCVETRCRTTRRPEACEGTLDISPSCCSTCATP